jgi:hypothetical protein
MVERATRVTADDFFTGLFAALTLKGPPVISGRGRRLDKALALTFEEFRKLAAAENLDVQFRIRLHPFHQDSITVKNEICHAAQQNLISLDNPEYQEIRLKLTKDEAEEILATFPTKELFLTTADKFLDSYETVSGLR